MSKRATRSSGETLVTPTDDDTSVKKKRKKKKSTKSMSQFHDTDILNSLNKSSGLAS